MNWRILFIIFGVLVVVCLALRLLSGTEQAEQFNAYEWEQASQSFKLGYVMGLSEGFYQCAVQFTYFYEELFLTDSLPNPQTLVDTFYKFLSLRSMEKVSYGQMINGVDKFYGDYRNKSLPVIDILILVKMEIMGKSTAQIDSAARILRQMYTE